uniref:Putative secreted protein n=1 Tax=Panstrongylus lignarius TaxID=156445 RepID=A0A224XF59_9HEMI
MIFIFHILLLLIILQPYSAGSFDNFYMNNDRESRKWANNLLKDFKPVLITDDTFKPKSYDAYIQMKREKLAKFGACTGYRCGNVKQMIKDGKLLNNLYIRTRKALPLMPLFPPRLRRSTDLKLKDEIDSIKIYPVESNGTKAIECHKVNDEEISCRQDDFEYKIKLKHKDLSQESLESLIRTLYLRLSTSISTEKRKRSEVLTAAPSSGESGEEPFMIVLPPQEPTPVNGCPEPKEEMTEWPYKVCKICEEPEEPPPPIDNMIIECSPRDYELINPDEPRVFNEGPTTQPSAYVYSCRWQGKRQVESQNIVVPIKSAHPSRTGRQSFRIIIDPSEASTNTLPITIAV